MKSRSILAGLFLMFSGAACAIDCPAGSYLWVDSYGNNICKSHGADGTTSIQGSTRNCPAGTHPWVDSYGNNVCQSFDNKEQYHDTSKGCPAGTYPWVDSWGNNVCKRF